MHYIILLCVIAQFKHFVADGLLQGEYMKGKFKPTGWFLPLFSHCAVHFVFTFTMVLGFSHNALLAAALGSLDLVVHFIMDRIKVHPKLMGRYEALSKDQYKGLMESKVMAKSAFKENFSGHPMADIAQDQARKEIIRIDKKFKSNVMFWHCLMLDQLVHHLTDLLVIAILVSYT